MNAVDEGRVPTAAQNHIVNVQESTFDCAVGQMTSLVLVKTVELILRLADKVEARAENHGV